MFGFEVAMKATAFLKTLTDREPTPGDPILGALWFDYHDQWHQAHALVQDLPSPAAAHLHAYLHRKEGDLGNAFYWYRKAAQPMPTCSLSEEWTQLVHHYTEPD
jgi:hypothetical protein